MVLDVHREPLLARDRGSAPWARPSSSARRRARGGSRSAGAGPRGAARTKRPPRGRVRAARRLRRAPEVALAAILVERRQPAAHCVIQARRTSATRSTHRRARHVDDRLVDRPGEGERRLVDVGDGRAVVVAAAQALAGQGEAERRRARRLAARRRSRRRRRARRASPCRRPDRARRRRRAGPARAAAGLDTVVRSTPAKLVV